MHGATAKYSALPTSRLFSLLCQQIGTTRYLVLSSVRGDVEFKMKDGGWTAIAAGHVYNQELL